MGPPAAAEEEQHREEDRDDDALQHPEHDHADARDEREHQRRHAHARVLTDGAQVDERQRGGDHDGGERRLWEVGEERVEEHQEDDDEPGADEVRHLGLGARLLGDRSARTAGGDGEPLEEAGGDVGRADADHLLVRLQLVAASRGEGRCGGDGVGERHEHDADGGQDQRPDITDRGERERRARDALWQRPDGCNPVVGQAQRRRQDRRTRDRHQHRRDPARDPRKEEQHEERADTDRERSTLRAIDVLDELADLVTEAVGVGREPEELRELAHDDRDGEPVHVADLHFTREQVGDETELGDTEGDLDEADEQGQHPREHDGAAWVVGHERAAGWRRR